MDSANRIPLSKNNPARYVHILGWTAAFGLGFGWMEATVVVYLRELFYSDGVLFPLRLLPEKLGTIEILREAATILMLLGFACAVSRKAWSRFGIFAVAFGVWDLVYYAALYLMIDWPASLADWDVLFLIPGIWTGPVWTACLIALLLIIIGGLLFVRGEQNTITKPLFRHWLLAATCLITILASFLANHALVLAGGIPTDFPLLVFVPAVLLAIATVIDLLR